MKPISIQQTQNEPVTLTGANTTSSLDEKLDRRSSARIRDRKRRDSTPLSAAEDILLRANKEREVISNNHRSGGPGILPPAIITTYPGTQRDQELVDALRASGAIDDVKSGTPDMPVHFKAFTWDTRSAAAAMLLADGTETVTHIAVSIHISLQTLSAWRSHPEFRRRVAELVETAGERLAAHALSSRQGRAKHAIRLVDALERVRTERAASATAEFYDNTNEERPAFEFDTELASTPGGQSGLLVRKERIIGTGTTAERVVEYEVDTAHINAELKAMEYIAKEQGQWTDKTEIDVTRKLYIDVNMDLL